MLATRGTSGTLETKRGHWPPVGFWTWQARKGRVRSGPWFLSGTSQGGSNGGYEAPWFQGYRARAGLQVSSGQVSEIC